MQATTLGHGLVLKSRLDTQRVANVSKRVQELETEMA